MTDDERATRLIERWRDGAAGQLNLHTLIVEALGEATDRGYQHATDHNANSHRDLRAMQRLYPKPKAEGT